ncbi:MAG: hypothetical protein ACD_11C00088G0001 [uncultured bacterium]|nr:MAG: hypothetical protein ACD_11C00088G0001 [uncultured bacterium]
MTKEQLKNLTSIFKSYPEIKLVYFFGSRAKGLEGPMSDYDFAVYFDEKNKKKMFDAKFVLMDQIGRFFRTDKIDIVVLNLTEAPELKYDIIKNGKLIYEKEPFRLIIEPNILNEYFDFQYLLRKYNLTKT